MDGKMVDMSDDQDGYWEALTHIDIWLMAVFLQRDRVVDNMREDLKLDMHDQSAPFEQHLARLGDGNLFVFSLHQLRLTVSLILRIADGREKGEIEGAINDFDSSCPQVKHMRDVLAHFDDYASGRGRMQRNRDSPRFRSTTETKIKWKGDERDVAEYSIEVDISPGAKPIRVLVNESTRAAFELSQKVKDCCRRLNARKASA